METFVKLSLSNLVDMINHPKNKRACQKVLLDHENLFRRAYGSTHNHQNWPGGYYDHISEVMNLAVWLYERSPRLHTFPLSDALVVLFLHDIEKPWKYEFLPDGEIGIKKDFDTEEKSHLFREKKIREYGFVLTSDQQNALKYVHGEGSDYSSKRRIMNPLAAFCHICDVWIARIYFDCPDQD